MDIVLNTSLLRRKGLEIEKESRFGNTQKAEQEDYCELEAAMAYIKLVLGQARLHSKILSQKQQQKQRKRTLPLPT